MKRQINSSINKLLCQMNKAIAINRTNLEMILGENQNTEQGKKYHFNHMRKIADYQKLPLSNEDLPHQKETNYQVKFEVLTSGTTGKRNKFHLTLRALNQYQGYIFQMPYYLLQCYRKNNLHMSCFEKKQTTILSSAYYQYLYMKNIIKNSTFVGGNYFMFNNFDDKKFYVKLRIALAYEDLFSIQSIYIYEILILFRYLDLHKEMILADIEQKKFSVTLDDKTKQKLNKIHYSKKRINELRKEFSLKTNYLLAVRIWKKLAFISGIKGLEFNIYEQTLKKYIGHLPIYSFAYAMSECIIGISLSFNSDEYALLPNSAFYEFRDLSTGEIVLPHKVNIGKNYEPIITTFSGLYRYPTKDKVIITGFFGQSPKLKVMGRIDNYLNIAGEKLSELEAQRVIEKLLNIYNIKIDLCYLGIDNKVLPYRYILFVQCEKKLDKAFSDLFDEMLKKENSNYLMFRQMGLIAKPVCLSIFKINQIKQEGHFKPKLFIDSSRVEQLRKEYLCEKDID